MAKSDHKRKARPIAPATVTGKKRKATPIPSATLHATAHEIVVVVPDVLGKNEAHQNGKGGRRFASKATDFFRASVEAAATTWRMLAMFGGNVVADIGNSQAMRGPWRAEVLGVWPRKRGKIEGRTIDFEAPMGDVDAPIAQCFDAVKRAGILDDDARLVDVHGWNLYRKDVRTTVIRLVPVTLTERDAAIAHLLPLVPQSPEQPARPKRARKAKSTC